MKSDPKFVLTAVVLIPLVLVIVIAATLMYFDGKKRRYARAIAGEIRECVLTRTPHGEVIELKEEGVAVVILLPRNIGKITVDPRAGQRALICFEFLWPPENLPGEVQRAMDAKDRGDVERGIARMWFREEEKCAVALCAASLVDP